MKLAILIPTYNEVKNIGLLLHALSFESEKLRNIYFNIYVIDDASPDGTSNLVKNLIPTLKSNNFKVNLINRKKKEGLGYAYIYAFRHILELPNPPNYVLQMDADLSHNPQFISLFVNSAIIGSDFVVGSRYIDGGSVPSWGWYRRFLSKSGNVYARTILGNLITDYTGGFNLFKFDLLKRLDLNSINHGGYGFLIALKYEISTIANKIEEVPIRFVDREHGESKMPLNTIFKNLVLVLFLRISKERKRFI